MNKKKVDETEKIAALSEEEVDKIERVENALANRYRAESTKILFERTAADMLPFIIYCMYDGGVLLIAYTKTLELKGTPEFMWAIAVLTITMCLPFLLLPRLPFKKWLHKETQEVL